MNASRTLFASAVILVCGCSTTTGASSASDPDASAASDASSNGDASPSEGDSSSRTCDLDAGEVCRESCCPVVRGQRIDFAKRCVERVLTVLGCPPPGYDCGSDDAIGCYIRRDSDGGAPEAYTTSQLHDIEGFKTCPDHLMAGALFPTCEE